MADYLDARAGKGGKPASLGRYKASIAKIHQLLDLKDPTPGPAGEAAASGTAPRKGTAQRQARPLRFKGPVRDVERDKARGLNIRAMLESCGDDCRACAIGRCCPLPTIPVCAPPSSWRSRSSISRAMDPEARLLQILRSKGDQDGEGATAYLSPRTVAAIAAWTEAAEITAGPLFRRVRSGATRPRGRLRGRPIDSISGRETWDLRKTLSKPAVKARVEYDIGTVALHPGSIGPIFRSIIQRAFDRGALPDLTAEDLAPLAEGHERAFDADRAQPGPVRERRGSRRDHGCAALEDRRACRSPTIATSRRKPGPRDVSCRN